MDSSVNNSQSKDVNILPLSTIKRIMKSSPDMELIAGDALISTQRATEMFINYMTVNAYAKIKGEKILEYNHLADYVTQDDRLEFLVHIIPHKMSVKKARELMSKPDSSSSEEDDDDNEEESDEEEEDETDEGNVRIDLTMSDGD